MKEFEFQVAELPDFENTVRKFWKLRISYCTKLLYIKTNNDTGRPAEVRPLSQCGRPRNKPEGRAASPKAASIQTHTHAQAHTHTPTRTHLPPAHSNRRRRRRLGVGELKAHSYCGELEARSARRAGSSHGELKARSRHFIMMRSIGKGRAKAHTRYYGSTIL